MLYGLTLVFTYGLIFLSTLVSVVQRVDIDKVELPWISCFVTYQCIGYRWSWLVTAFN